MHELLLLNAGTELSRSWTDDRLCLTIMSKDAAKKNIELNYFFYCILGTAAITKLSIRRKDAEMKLLTIIYSSCWQRRVFMYWPIVIFKRRVCWGGKKKNKLDLTVRMMTMHWIIWRIQNIIKRKEKNKVKSDQWNFISLFYVKKNVLMVWKDAVSWAH